MAIEHEIPPDPYPDDNADDGTYWRERDRIENESTRPPEGEEVRRPGLLLTDCFVAGDADRLVDGLTALGFDPEGWLGPGSGFATWIQRARRTGQPAGWLQIGSVVAAPAQAWRFHGQVQAELPEEFTHVLLRISAPVPGLITLTALFQLREAAALGIDDQLRTDRFLRLEKSGTITSYSSARHRKHEAVRAERESMREAATTWMAQTFAGTLTAQFQMSPLPCTELLTFKQHAPFVETDDRPSVIDGDYRTMLSTDHDTDAFESPELRGWRVGAPWRGIDPQWTLVAGCRDPGTVGNASEQEQEADLDRPSPRPTALHQLLDTLAGLNEQFAVLALLSNYEAELARVRDELASTETGEATLRRLSTVRSTLSDLTFDAALVAHGVASWAEHDGLWGYDVPRLLQASAWRRERDPEVDLSGNLRWRVQGAATWIAEMEGRLREQLTITTNIEAASTNIKLVQVTLVVSLLALLVAVLAPFVLGPNS
jgi:hypothetical protein